MNLKFRENYVLRQLVRKCFNVLDMKTRYEKLHLKCFVGILVIVKSTLCTYLFHLFIFLLQFLAVIFSTLIAYNREPVHPEEMDGTNPSWPIHIIVILILFSTLDLFNFLIYTSCLFFNYCFC